MFPVIDVYIHVYIYVLTTGCRCRHRTTIIVFRKCTVQMYCTVFCYDYCTVYILQYDRFTKFHKWICFFFKFLLAWLHSYRPAVSLFPLLRTC